MLLACFICPKSKVDRIENMYTLRSANTPSWPTLLLMNAASVINNTFNFAVHMILKSTNFFTLNSWTWQFAKLSSQCGCSASKLDKSSARCLAQQLNNISQAHSVASPYSATVKRFKRFAIHNHKGKSI